MEPMAKITLPVTRKPVKRIIRCIGVIEASLLKLNCSKNSFDIQ